MESFWINVLASVISSSAILAVTAVLSRRARWVLTGILGRLLAVDIEGVFSDKRAAEADVRTELARSREVAIFTGRGNELQRDTFEPIFLGRPASTPRRVRVLLPCTEATVPSDWTQQRENKLAAFDPAFGKPGLLRDQIETNARFLSRYVDAGVELRRFSCPHIGRLVITDRFAYFTPYRDDAHVRGCPVYKFRRGDLYDNFSRLFEQLWDADNSKPE